MSINNIKLTISGLIEEMSISDYYKQSLVFVAVFFAGELFNTAAIFNTIVTAISFSLTASMVYIFNDIFDREEDRKHPEKQHRPIASGQVSVKIAAIFGLFIGAIGLILSATVVNIFVTGILLLYIIQNIIYNAFTRQLIIYDILTVSIGFVLRALAGVYAINSQIVIPSEWLLICTFFAALLLAIGKRRKEAITVSNSESRQSMSKYSVSFINTMLQSTSSVLIISYGVYTINQTPHFIITIPFATYAVFRYYYLITETDIQSFKEILRNDPSFVSSIVLWIGVLFLIMYGQVILV